MNVTTEEQRKFQVHCLTIQVKIKPVKKLMKKCEHEKQKSISRKVKKKNKQKTKIF